MFFKPPPGPQLTLLNIFLFGCYSSFVFVKIFCIQILTNISFNIFCTFWYRRTNNRQIGFCYPHSLRMRNIFMSLPGDESWAHVTVTCDKGLLQWRNDCWDELTAVTAAAVWPPVSTDIWQCQGQGWSPWCWCQTWLMAQSLDQPRPRSEERERG